MNSVTLMGRLGKDPELKYTAGNKAIANFSVATSSYSRGQDGESKEVTEWHRIVCFDKQAENCAKFLQKGARALVSGRIKYGKYTDKNGVEKYTTDILANHVEFIDFKPKEGTPEAAVKQEKGTVKDALDVGMDQPMDLNEIPF